MEDELHQTVTVPDAEDVEGLPENPLDIHTKTDEGIVRPAVIMELLNREQRRRILKEARKAQRDNPGAQVAIVVPKPRTKPETTAYMADMIIGEWEKYHQYFPLQTLQNFLDDRSGRIMEQAILKGRPVDRDAVREAVGALWDEAQQKTSR